MAIIATYTQIRTVVNTPVVYLFITSGTDGGVYVLINFLTSLNGMKPLIIFSILNNISITPNPNI